MDSGSKGERPPNPRASANPISALTFWWILGTFWRGYKRDLEVEDLPEPLKEHRSDLLGDKFERLWQSEVARAAKINKGRRGGGGGDAGTAKAAVPSLTRVIVRAFGPRLALYGVVLAVMEIALRVSQPLFLGRLVMAFGSQASVSRDEAYLYAAGVVLCSALNVFVIHPYMMAIFHMGMKIRVACCSLIYRKALRLSQTALGETTAGQAVNLLSNDVTRFDLAVIFLHYLWIGPLETVLVTYLMWYDVGVAAVIGVATILMFIPMQAFLGKYMSTLRLRTAIRTDERVRLMNEIISGIQVIKMYTWERPFNKLVEAARRAEMKALRATAYIRGVGLSFIMFNTRISIFVSVLAYVLGGGDISAEKVFVITAYYNILRQTMTVFFPQGITQMAEAFVSIGRLQRFLLYDETPRLSRPSDESLASRANGVAAPLLSSSNGPSSPPTNAPAGAGSEAGVRIMAASAQWTADAPDLTLSSVSLSVRPGQIVGVVGPVGAGKSSLLQAILGELPLRAGSIAVRGRVAYASQEPWLFAGSVRQNILFGRPFERARYKEVVGVCALKRDFELLPFGDKTVVGERGVSLSGGQRARINLARAVYMDADVYLLDDPLSAVDTHVGRHLFEDCIAGYLAGKAVLLVTHQLQYLKAVDNIVVVENGAVRQQGTFAELQAAGTDLSELLQLHGDDDGTEKNAGAADKAKGREDGRSAGRNSLSSVNSMEVAKGAQAAAEEAAEGRARGTVSGAVYRRYLAAGGPCCAVFATFLLCVLAQLAASGADYWITYWTNVEEVRSNARLDGSANGTQPRNSSAGLAPGTRPGQLPLLSRETCIYVYSGVVAGVVVLTLSRSFAFFSMCARASQSLHDAMFRCVTHAKMRFFHTNPSGRILNRFSKDMGSVDELLPQCMIDVIQIGLQLLGVIVVLAVVNYWLLVPTVVVGAFFYLMRHFYLATSRAIKRMEGITRSPVFSHLNASLQGLTTIRAFGAQEVLVKEFDNHQDVHSSAWFFFIATSRAFGFWLDMICVAYIAIVTFSFLLLGHEVFGGNVGLAITQAITLTGMFQWGMRQSAEMENQMTSVERIAEYNALEQEPPLESPPGKGPPRGWPSEGRVEFVGVSLRYGPSDDPVLKSLRFVVKPGEKVGIVGRTGAGKSSLITALFRLAEIEGTIDIDGVDTSTLGLHDLRRCISIIPQEPVLFTGPLRKNLDPFEEFADEALLRALDEVELGEVMQDLPAGLSSKVAEGGSNFSVGQRQLVCLARAILRNNKILVLDEATANVDPHTDALIQTTIRQKFASCTVLTIAHRLNTVMDSDRVLVMDSGVMVEFAHPHELLQNPESVFYQMVQQTGRGMAEALAKMAEQNYTTTSPTPEDDSSQGPVAS